MISRESFWDIVASSYERTEKRFEQYHMKTVEKTKKYLKKNNIVLDYGCGPGTKSLEIAGIVKKVHGIDISSKMIEAAKRKAAERRIENIDFVQTAIFDTRYKGESFDVITAFNILHAFKDSQPIIQRILEILKPGGLFISVTPCLGEKMTVSNRFQFYFFLLLSRTGLIPYVKSYKFYELRNSIADKRFQIIETEYFYHIMSSYYIVAKKM